MEKENRSPESQEITFRDELNYAKNAAEETNWAETTHCLSMFVSKAKGNREFSSEKEEAKKIIDDIEAKMQDGSDIEENQKAGLTHWLEQAKDLVK